MNQPQKSKIFQFDYGYDSHDLFCPDIFKEFWIREYMNNHTIFQLLRNTANKHIDTYKVTFYELFERLKTMYIEPEEKDELLTELDKIQMEIKEGDFVNIDDERMVGFYYFDGYNFMQTTGNYCKIVPEQGFKFVESHGTVYFEDLPYDPYVKVPKSIKVVDVKHDDAATATIMDEPVAIPIKNDASEDDHDGYYLINDKKYFY